MRADRRRFLAGVGVMPVALGALLLGASGTALYAQRRTVSDFPDPNTFQAGDLVWPKKKGSIVPRMRALSQSADAGRQAWEAARNRLLAQDPAQSGISPEVARQLRNMSYEEFERLYFRGRAQSAPASRFRRRGAEAVSEYISVGHVGMIDVDERGVPHVVEATPNSPLAATGGVIRSPYADWIKSYSNIQVWHGRVRDLDQPTRQRLVKVAASQLGKPYDFFNFDLNDDRGFYCSKLVWMSIWRGASLAIDGNAEPRRGSRFPPWFSPKELINVSAVTLLHKPGEY